MIGIASKDLMHAPDTLLVCPKDDVEDYQLEAVYNGLGGIKHHHNESIRVHRIKVPAGRLEHIEALLRAHPQVKYVERDHKAAICLVPNDPGYATQWHHPVIHSPEAWDVETGNQSVVVAVLDSGIDLAHPDLVSNTVGGHNFLDGSSNVQDNGSNGGHGTACAGCVAAVGNNGQGVAGVTWHASIMPLVVVQNDFAQYSDLVNAMTYAADHGAKVISMSMAGSNFSQAVIDAANYCWSKGCLMVASAGNNANNTPQYPAVAPNVIGCTATDQNDAPATFTSFGDWVKVAAPGVRIHTSNLGGGYGNWSGTSFSCPITAGLAALLWSKFPQASNAQINALITKYADDLGAAGFDVYYGYGRINVFKSITQGATMATVTVPLSYQTIQVSGNVTVSKREVAVLDATGNLVDSKDVTTMPASIQFLITVGGTYQLRDRTYDQNNVVVNERMGASFNVQSLTTIQVVVSGTPTVN